MSDLHEQLDALRQITTNLDGYLERRAAELAQPLIDKANAAADERVQEAEFETRRQTDLVTELRRQLAPADRYRQRVKDAEQRAEAAETALAAQIDRGAQLEARVERFKRQRAGWSGISDLRAEANEYEAELDRLREAVRDYAERRFVDGYLGGGKTWRELSAELRALADPHAALDQPGDQTKPGPCAHCHTPYATCRQEGALCCVHCHHRPRPDQPGDQAGAGR